MEIILKNEIDQRISLFNRRQINPKLDRYPKNRRERNDSGEGKGVGNEAGSSRGRKDPPDDECLASLTSHPRSIDGVGRGKVNDPGRNPPEYRRNTGLSSLRKTTETGLKRGASLLG